ncbi:hypothetical protein [Bartonella gabonensis]|uniref:hypothetical protein n=1 Tax=Bartonella gabonensis TaxID=2699889 RepID=UPI001588FB0D|nr:hypothetical protein [Bartonella gabonensis]
MKSLSITLVIIFIAFFSISVLSTYTKIDSLEQYDKLYEEYVSKNYRNLEYHQKLAKAKESAKDLKKFMVSTVDIPHDKSPFWRHLITLPSNPPEFNILKHYHIVLVFCGRFADLWQGDPNMPTLTFNDLKAELEDFKSSVVKNEPIWLFIKRIFLIAKFETSFNDPMFEYAEQFLDSPNGISKKEQTLRTEEIMITRAATRFSNTARMCNLAIDIYRTMMPQENVRPPVRYSSFEKWKRYLTSF